MNFSEKQTWLEPVSYTHLNQVMTSYAEAVPGKYEKSTSVSVQSAIYGWEALKDNDYVKTTFHDFYGDRPGSLYNQVMMEKIGDVTEPVSYTHLPRLFRQLGP